MRWVIAILLFSSCATPSKPQQAVIQHHEYYRVKQVDKDGRVMYSKVIVIEK